MALSPVVSSLPKPIWFSIVVCTLMFGQPASARAESMRVLLAQDVPHVEVRSESDIVLIGPNGEARKLRTPALFSVLGTAIGINGKKIVGDRIEVRPLKAGLSIGFPKGLTGGHTTSTVSPALLAENTQLSSMPFSGGIRIVLRGKGLSVINLVDLEEYVKGVVPYEVSSSWHPEMLKVQAVAARTYALYNKMLSAAREYDVMSTIQDQVYRGRTGVDNRVEQAVDHTRGMVVTHRNAPIYAAFSSTAAGPTEDAANVWAKDLPYLKGVECPFDLSSPYYQWKISVKSEHLESNLRQQGFMVGTVATITPVAFSRAGRVTKVRILHSRGELILRGEDLRKAVGYTVIPSTQFEVESIGADIVFVGYGAGHAVGLCQWGAKELAELGYPYMSILRYYYPGTELRNAALAPLSPPPNPSP